MTTLFGVVVIAGRSYEITSITIKGGELVIIARRSGPVPALDREPVTVFGADGQGAFQGGEVSMERVGRRDQARVTVRLRLEKVWDREGSQPA